MQNFEGNRKMFWKEIKRERKEKGSSRSIGMKDENGDMLVNMEEVGRVF